LERRVTAKSSRDGILKRHEGLTIVTFGPQSCSRMDKSIYEYSDLTDDEILEREEKLDAQNAAEAEQERKRIAKARNFRFVGGML
jgi:SUMO ligase MMS21 Smc5/6 complex component